MEGSRRKLQAFREKNLLFLSSYDPADDVFSQQLEGMEEVLHESNVHLDTINMDFQHFNHEEDVEAFYSFVKSRLEYREKPYDGILVGDNRALRFAMQYKEELFPNLPLVFFSVDSKNLAEEAGKNSEITGYYCPSFMKETLDTATALQPKAETIMAIYDNSFVGTEAKDEFFSLQRNFPEYRFSGINFSQLKREEFQEALQGIQENTILLFLSASRDKDGNNYPASQMVKLILSTVDTPVYGNAMIQNISGFLGGRVQDYRQMAKDGTLLILDVLSSKQKIKELTYREDAPGSLSLTTEYLWHTTCRRRIFRRTLF